MSTLSLAQGGPFPAVESLPLWLVGELRSDHAGETGAVMIYRGILAISRDPAVRAFAERHRATEQGHLDLLDRLLPAAHRSRLLPVWRVAGWLTGAIPALFGPRAVWATIDAVESFVDHHYQAQIDRLDAEGILPDLRAALEHCRIEELHHRDEARDREQHDRGPRPFGTPLRVWAFLVDRGSKAAVAAAKRL